LRKARLDDAADFQVHPAGSGEPYYIITYIEPEPDNRLALGLNIAFERHRRQAADLSGDTGKAAITRRIVLVQDEQQTPGFLLLYPLYRDAAFVDTAQHRRAALQGWIFAPFIAKNFLADLTRSQGDKLTFRIYDGREESPATLIFGSGATARAKPAFTVRKQMEVMQQQWLVVWESTPAFEQSERSDGTLFILVGGLIFTGMFGLFLMVVTVRRTETMEWLAGDRQFTLPLLIFLLVSAGSYALYARLQEQESSYVSKLIHDETRKIELLLTSQTSDRLLAFKRMAQRWEIAAGTPYALWQNDARNYTRQLAGLRTMEWVDSAFQVRWVEPPQDVEKTIGLDIASDLLRAQALEGSAERSSPTLTPPFHLAQGYTAFVVYQPLTVRGRFDGFLAGIFSIEEFFGTGIVAEIADSHTFTVSYDGKIYFTNNAPSESAGKLWASEKSFQILDKRWTLRIVPTRQFVESQQTSLPLAVLLAGLLIAALSALSVRYIMVSRLKAAYLETSSRALRDSEERYDLAVRGMSVGLWDWNVATNTFYWSDKFKQIAGVEDDFVPHDNEFADRLHPDDKEATLAMLVGHIEGRNPYNVEYRLRRNDGHYVWIHAFGQARWDAEGKPVRMAGSVDDISEKKQQEQALKISAEQMRVLVENTPAAVAMLDRELRYMLMSRRWLQDYRLEGRQIIGERHYDVFPEIAAMPAWLDIHRRALGGEVFDMQEDSWVRADGRQEWIEWAIRPWIDHDGQVGGIVMFTEVITGRKRAEEALRASEETFRTAMENAPIGQALLLPDGRWLKVNPSLCRLLGYSEAELLANDFQSITHPDDLEQDLAALRKLLAGEIRTYQMEKRYYRKEGQVIRALLSVSLVRRENDEPHYLIAQIQDITERKEMERMKSEFISIVSHELRTPLTSIRGSLGLMLGALAKDLPEKVRRLVDIAYNNCERLVLLINDILDIDKIASGHMRFDLKDESLAAVTLQAVLANEGYARKFDACIELAPIDARISVKLDAARYVQVLSNLLSNAAKFSPPGGKIRVSASLAAERVRLCVRDQGSGIPEEFRTRIFGKFSQADSSTTRDKGGTGLGLHITQQLVEHMNGSIGFDTQVGQGTTFWVEFPLAAAPSAAARSRSEGEEPVLYYDESQPHRPRVLHVEDDADLSKVLAVALQDEAEVVTATTLHQAAELLSRRTFAMIILDVAMPDGSGLELLERLNTLTDAPPPVIMLSADLPPPQLCARVAAVMVKTRTPEDQIVATILSLLRQDAGGKSTDSAENVDSDR
jgi:PAS domain S-box-containing protein